MAGNFKAGGGASGRPVVMMTPTKLIVGSLLTAVALTAVPVNGQVVDAEIGNYYSCNSSTDVCTTGTSGFHQGTAPMVGVSTYYVSTGFCAIVLTACQSIGAPFTASTGDCFLATADTQLGPIVLASDSGQICLPGLNEASAPWPLPPL